MGMYESEKNLLEKLADAVPGLRGYRDKEARRDTDKRFREYLASRIEGAKRSVDDTTSRFVEMGKLDGLDKLDRLSQRLIKIAGSIRHASYGYSGFFDQVKIQEAELDRIYQFDLSLLADVEALENRLKQLPPSATEGMQEWDTAISALEKRVEERKNLFTTTP